MQLRGRGWQRNRGRGGDCAIIGADGSDEPPVAQYWVRQKGDTDGSDETRSTVGEERTMREINHAVPRMRVGLGSRLFLFQFQIRFANVAHAYLARRGHTAESRAALPHTNRMHPAATPCSSCRRNDLGAEGATALSSGLTALTNLQSLNLR